MNISNRNSNIIFIVLLILSLLLFYYYYHYYYFIIIIIIIVLLLLSLLLFYYYYHYYYFIIIIIIIVLLLLSLSLFYYYYYYYCFRKAIGIDNVFILMSGYRQSNLRDTVEERISETFRTTAITITIASLTDVLAFCIGATSTYMSVRNFCIYTGKRITDLYSLNSCTKM